MIPGRRVVPPRKRLPAVRLDSIWRPTASSFMAFAHLSGNSRHGSLAENEAVHRQPPWPPQGCFGFPELGLACVRGDAVTHVAPLADMQCAESRSSLRLFAAWRRVGAGVTRGNVHSGSGCRRHQSARATKSTPRPGLHGCTMRALCRLSGCLSAP